MGLRKDIKRQAQRAERAAAETADAFVADQMKTLADAFNAQAVVLKRKKKKRKMSFTVKGMCRHGELMHRRKTPEAALRKARELAKTGCYNLHIITPDGRDYDSSEFADIPHSHVAERQKSRIHTGVS